MFTWISRKKHEELYQKNKNLWYKSYGNKLDEWTSLALEEGWCYNYSEFEGIDEDIKGDIPNIYRKSR